MGVSIHGDPQKFFLTWFWATKVALLEQGVRLNDLQRSLQIKHPFLVIKIWKRNSLFLYMLLMWSTQHMAVLCHTCRFVVLASRRPVKIWGTHRNLPIAFSCVRDSYTTSWFFLCFFYFLFFFGGGEVTKAAVLVKKRLMSQTQSTK